MAHSLQVSTESCNKEGVIMVIYSRKAADQMLLIFRLKLKLKIVFESHVLWKTFSRKFGFMETKKPKLLAETK